jgi:NAD(P)-dependent dehydrogenase (short-subunit alcohol dehydrogenase family)
MARVDFDDLQGEKYSGQHAYNASKLANVMFTYELARRLQGTGVTANMLHPGVVRTSFGAEDQPTYFRLLIPLMWPFMKTAAQGAEARHERDAARIIARRAVTCSLANLVPGPLCGSR